VLAEGAIAAIESNEAVRRAYLGSTGIAGEAARMLALHDVDSFYGRSHALHGVSMTVADRAITAVLVRNGVGKTTLLKTIMGPIDRMRGRIELEGADIAAQPAFRRARLGIAYVPQGRDIIPDFSIRENILTGAFARRDGKRATPDLVTRLFPYLAQNLDRPAGVLSDGQQLQLAIARARRRTKGPAARRTD